MDNIYKATQEYFKLRGLSPNTQRSYLRVIRQFAKYFNESPENLGTDHIKKYLLDLIKNDRSASTIEVAHAALTFLYQTVLDKPWKIDTIPHHKQKKRLPVILNRDEIKRFFSVITNIKHRAILSLLYSAGLRVSEVITLPIRDIDSERMQIRVHNGKGAKDRYTILSKTSLQLLRHYFKIYRPRTLLFPTPREDKAMTYKAISIMFNKYKKLAGITKPATAHSLRHSFATHLLENGIDIYHIQRLLGHRSIETTTVYLHVRRVDLQKIISPLDLINKK